MPKKKKNSEEKVPKPRLKPKQSVPSTGYTRARTILKRRKINRDKTTRKQNSAQERLGREEEKKGRSNFHFMGALYSLNIIPWCSYFVRSVIYERGYKARHLEGPHPRVPVSSYRENTCLLKHFFFR